MSSKEAGAHGEIIDIVPAGLERALLHWARFRSVASGFVPGPPQIRMHRSSAWMESRATPIANRHAASSSVNRRCGMPQKYRHQEGGATLRVFPAAVETEG
jgi:hypothetical protein